MKKVIIIVLLMLAFSMQSMFAQNQLKPIKVQDHLSYSFNKTLQGLFEEVTNKVKSALKDQGFGVITEIDMDVTLKEKLSDVEMNPYKILGVCNPKFAYQTIQLEENIGLFLPCKVLIKDLGDGKVEVVMVNPSALMQMLGNKDLVRVANDVTEKFKAALEEIK